MEVGGLSAKFWVLVYREFDPLAEPNFAKGYPWHSLILKNNVPDTRVGRYLKIAGFYSEMSRFVSFTTLKVENIGTKPSIEERWRWASFVIATETCSDMSIIFLKQSSSMYPQK